MKKNFIILLVIGTAIISLVCGIFIGRALPKQPEVSFYANILENSDAYLLIEGISENDINHRSQFTVTLKNKYSSVLDINGTSINLSDIPEGCLVRIIYDGIVHETYPAQIDGVISIQIVE